MQIKNFKNKKVRLCFGIGLLFLLLQVGQMIHSRFIPERFFCWAPYGEHTYLEINVHIGEKSLSLSEIEDRYRYKAKGWEARSIDNIFSMIKQYENTYGKIENANVVVKYSTNGHKEQIWRYPE